jgi:anti-sigma factor RsiW
VNNDLLNILSNSNKDIDNQKLMDYLAGNLPENERHEVEKWMVDNDFANEAVEGLQDFQSNKNLQAFVDHLNKDLHKYIQQKKERREKRRIKENPWVFVAIVFILVIVVVAYLVIKRMQQAQ